MIIRALSRLYLASRVVGMGQHGFAPVTYIILHLIGQFLIARGRGHPEVGGQRGQSVEVDARISNRL